MCVKEDGEKEMSNKNESHEASFDSIPCLSYRSFYSSGENENPITKATSSMTPTLIAFNLHNISKFLYNSKFKTTATEEDFKFMQVNDIDQNNITTNDPKKENEDSD